MYIKSYACGLIMSQYNHGNNNEKYDNNDQDEIIKIEDNRNSS